MKRRALLLTALLAAPHAIPEDPASLRQRLSEIQGRLSQVDQRIQALKKRRKGILIDLQQVALQVERARAQADGARIQRDQAQAEVNLLLARKGQIYQELSGLQGALRRQARWMQATGPWGAFGFLASLRSFEGYLEQERYLTWWRNRERGRLSRVQSLHSELAQREHALQSALARLHQEEKAAAEQQVGLQHHEGRLQAFLGEVQQDEGKQKALQAELAEEALQLDRKLDSLLRARPKDDTFEAGTSFAALRGELPQPVQGSLAQGFGEHIHPTYRTKTFQSGLLIAAGGGQPVSAVAPGRVFFAEAFQSYGPTVILDHGGGFFTLYTHLQSTPVRKGQVLQAGETLGAVGDTPEGPRLGFQIRQQTTPQDPNKWLKLRYQ